MWTRLILYKRTKKNHGPSCTFQCFRFFLCLVCPLRPAATSLSHLFDALNLHGESKIQRCVCVKCVGKKVKMLKSSFVNHTRTHTERDQNTPLWLRHALSHVLFLVKSTVLALYYYRPVISSNFLWIFFSLSKGNIEKFILDALYAQPFKDFSFHSKAYSSVLLSIVLFIFQAYLWRYYEYVVTFYHFIFRFQLKSRFNRQVNSKYSWNEYWFVESHSRFNAVP